MLGNGNPGGHKEEGLGVCWLGGRKPGARVTPPFGGFPWPFEGLGFLGGPKEGTQLPMVLVPPVNCTFWELIGCGTSGGGSSCLIDATKGRVMSEWDIWLLSNSALVSNVPPVPEEPGNVGEPSVTLLEFPGTWFGTWSVTPSSWLLTPPPNPYIPPAFPGTPPP